MNKKLRTAMRGNLLFSSFSAISFLVAPTTIATTTGIPEIVVQLVGLGLIGFAGLLWFGIQSENTDVAKIVVILDILWVVSSFALLLSGWIKFSIAGIVGLISISFIVAGLAIWQQQGIQFKE